MLKTWPVMLRAKFRSDTALTRLEDGDVQVQQLQEGRPVRLCPVFSPHAALTLELCRKAHPQERRSRHKEKN